MTKGGTNNLFDAENAYTDASVVLHMQIKKNRAGGRVQKYF